VSDGDMPGYFARPAGVNNPPMILVAMEIFGLHEYIKDVTRRLAKLGAFGGSAESWQSSRSAPHGFHADYRAS
jgi:hypothetical protein